MEVQGSTWFTEMGGTVIGIVIVELDDREMQEYGVQTPVQAFIGTALPGSSQELDVKKIVTTGAKFPLKEAEELCS